MKNKFLVLTVFLGIISIFCLYNFYLLKSNKLDNEEKQRMFQLLVGSYKLDTFRTQIEVDEINSNLRLFLNKDSSFNFTNKVPYVIDTFGFWSSTGIMLDETCKLYLNSGVVVPFTKIYLDGKDSIIHIIDMVPSKDQLKIQDIYFLKESRLKSSQL